MLLESTSPVTFSILVFLAFLKFKHKISFFNARGFKLDHFDVFKKLSPFQAFVKWQPIIL